MIRYAITDSTLLAQDKPARREALLHLAARWAAEGVDYMQLREKDLSASELEVLSRAITAILRSGSGKTRLLVNAEPGLALAAGVDGVHLVSTTKTTPAEVRARFAGAGLPTPVVSTSCHTVEEVVRARENAVDLILFGPVFGKTVGGSAVAPPAGLDALRQACIAAAAVPVLALGGVNAANIESCLAAGAQGIAAIRYFMGE